MKLTLNQKQLVRSFSDIIVHNPESARVLINTQHIDKLGLFEHIQNVIEFVRNYQNGNRDVEGYLAGLRTEIDKVPNKEMKIILSSAITVEELERI